MQPTKLTANSNDSIKRTASHSIHPFIFKATGTITLIAIILSIVGTTQTTDFMHNMSNSKTKASLVLFLVAWLGLGILLLLVGARFSSIEAGEHRLLFAVSVSMPLILIRLVYSYLSVFGQRRDFNMFTGNVTIMLVMVVLEQIGVVVVCLGFGLTLDRKEDVVTTSYRAS